MVKGSRSQSDEEADDVVNGKNYAVAGNLGNVPLQQEKLLLKCQSKE